MTLSSYKFHKNRIQKDEDHPAKVPPRGKSFVMNQVIFLISRSTQPQAPDNQVSWGPPLVEVLVLNIWLPTNFSDNNPAGTHRHYVHPTARTPCNVYARSTEDVLLMIAALGY